jgi:hypothetical protein
MYAVVRHYTDEASDVVEQARQREESIKELMRGIDGFAAYYLIDTQSGGLASVSVFQDRAGAEVVHAGRRQVDPREHRRLGAEPADRHPGRGRDRRISVGGSA